MRLVLACCAVIVPAFYMDAAHAESGPSALKPWISRQTTFNIPFSVDLSRGMPREVQLFVSSDAGKTWHFYGRQVPTAKSFPFRATGDGDYWFASRTIDLHRSVPSLAQLRAELHVQVDTKQPQLDFNATPGSSGEITATWNVSDATLDPNSLKIECQVSPDTAWRPVAVDPAKLRIAPGSLTGDLTWYPQDGASAVTVRAEVTDGAGNRAVVTRQVAVATSARDLTSQSVHRPGVPAKPASQSSQSPVSNRLTQQSSETNLKPSAGAMTWPSDNKLRPVDSPIRTESSSAELSSATARQGESSDSRHGLTTAPAISPAPPDPAATPGTRTSERLMAKRSSPSLPPGERARMTNSLHFQLDYELDSVGPEGVDEVQLWGSTDYGQSWVRWSLDEDLRSPFEIQVERDGIYGFRVVIVGRNGLATPAPHTGDLADIWVGIDTTPPSARITSAIYGEGIHAGELDIHWEADDAWLGDRAITLLFSEHPNGPWTTIAAGLPNTGQHYWSLDPNTPRSIYLRLEVHDEAGNMAQHQLVEPISTTGLVPKAYIRSVRPVATPPQEAVLHNRFYPR